MIFYKEKFKTLRESLDLRQDDIARYLGIKFQSVQGWESGKTVPRPQKIHKLADLFRCKVSDLCDMKTPEDFAEETEPEPDTERKQEFPHKVKFYHEKFYELFINSGMKQTFIAERCGVSISAVSSWLTGRSIPRLRSIDKLAELFHCKKSEISNIPDFNEPADENERSFRDRITDYIDRLNEPKRVRLSASITTLVTTAWALDVPEYEIDTVIEATHKRLNGLGDWWKTTKEEKELIRWILTEKTFSISQKSTMMHKYFTIENGGAE